MYDKITSGKSSAIVNLTRAAFSTVMIGSQVTHVSVNSTPNISSLLKRVFVMALSLPCTRVSNAITKLSSAN